MWGYVNTTTNGYKEYVYFSNATHISTKIKFKITDTKNETNIKDGEFRLSL